MNKKIQKLLFINKILVPAYSLVVSITVNKYKTFYGKNNAQKELKSGIFRP
jgi:hypothetical protein